MIALRVRDAAAHTHEDAGEAVARAERVTESSPRIAVREAEDVAERARSRARRIAERR